MIKNFLFCISIFFILVACKGYKEEYNKITFSSQFFKKEKSIHLTLVNNTYDDFIVLVPSIISFKTKGSNYDKRLDFNPVEAHLVATNNVKYEIEMDSICKKVNNIYNINDAESKKYFPTATLIKKNEKMILKYVLNGNLVPNQIYTSKLMRMRDILNIPYNIEIIKNMLDYRKLDRTKIYLDDFFVKDSLEIK